VTDLSVCFGTINRFSMLKGCIESVRQAVGNLTYEIVITDAGSTDGTLEYLHAQHDVKVVEHGERRGAVAAYYDALTQAIGEYVCYLSDDLIVPGGMLAAAVDYLKKHPKCGVVSLPYRNPGCNVERIIFCNIGKKRLPCASFGVLRRIDGQEIDWCPRVTYHYYLDTGICLGVQTLWKTIDVLPGPYVIEHLLGDNLTRGARKDPRYSQKRDGAAFNEYWRDKV